VNTYNIPAILFLFIKKYQATAEMACAFENMCSPRQQAWRHRNDDEESDRFFIPFHSRWGSIMALPAFLENALQEPSQTGKCGRSRRQCQRQKQHPYADKTKNSENTQNDEEEKVMKMTVDDWEESVDMTGFTEDDISVRRFGRRLMIRAVQEGGDHGSSWGYSRRELVRSLELPDNLILRSLRTELTDDGQLKVTGKKIERKTTGEIGNHASPSDQASEETNHGTINDSQNMDDENGQESNSDKNKENNIDKSEDVAMETSGHNEDQPAEKSDEKENGSVSNNSESCEVTTPKIDITDHIFEESIKVSGFKPEDVSVKVVDNTVLVVADSKEENDGVFVHKHLEKSYSLPQGVSPDSLHSVLTKEGILTISNDKKEQHLGNDIVMSLEGKRISKN